MMMMMMMEGAVGREKMDGKDSEVRLPASVKRPCPGRITWLEVFA